MAGHSDVSGAEFVPETVHKRDMLSQTISGRLDDAGDFPVVLRRLDQVPLYAKPLAWWLARREIRALGAVQGIRGCPTLLRVNQTGLLRSWTQGVPLHLAKPDTPDWYRDARRLLRDMRRAGVTHNDTAKPQNWLMTPDRRAAVIDFQLATVHRRRGWVFQTMAREDLRHLLKQKRAYAPHLLSPSEQRLLANKSLPARLWMTTGKRLYTFITRRLMHWSDGDGTEDRIDKEGPALRTGWLNDPRITGLALSTYARPAKGVGLYAFVETTLDEAALRRMVPGSNPDAVHPVRTLPRDENGNTRLDALHLIAANRLDELQDLIHREDHLAAALADIIAHRRNLTDRVFK